LCHFYVLDFGAKQAIKYQSGTSGQEKHEQKAESDPVHTQRRFAALSLPTP
jgi:hypothetical protein